MLSELAACQVVQRLDNNSAHHDGDGAVDDLRGAHGHTKQLLLSHRAVHLHPSSCMFIRQGTNLDHRKEASGRDVLREGRGGGGGDECMDAELIFFGKESHSHCHHVQCTVTVHAAFSEGGGGEKEGVWAGQRGWGKQGGGQQRLWRGSGKDMSSGQSFITCDDMRESPSMDGRGCCCAMEWRGARGSEELGAFVRNQIV